MAQESPLRGIDATHDSWPEAPPVYWFGARDAVEHWFHGVFEGGGAKGVAYTGALRAMAAQRCWFRGVAGASAGAITAALVAAGLSPEDLEGATDDALRQVRTGTLAGLRRMRDETGYFPSHGLRDWLERLLVREVSRVWERTSSDPVTFRDLHDATRIELTVVAADLSLRRQVVFSHLETPDCAVADAVVASSSIPFAFESQLLEVPGANGDVFHHTLVDGGVWSNFPMYIFEDAAFRGYYGRTPEWISPQRILGFLLQEGDGTPPPSGPGIRFVRNVKRSRFRAREWLVPAEREQVPATGTGARIGAWLLTPFALLGRLLDWNANVDSGRWPTPRSKALRNLVRSVNGLLGGVYPLLFAVFALYIVGLGAWTVGSGIALGQLRVLPERDWADLPWEPLQSAIALLLGVLGLAISVLLPFVMLVGLVADGLLLRAARRILYGLVTTYVAGSGAPEWVSRKANIVALPVPPEVTTLSFDMDETVRRELVDGAERVTREKLTELLRASPT